MRFLLLLVIGLVCLSFTDAANILRRRSSSTEEKRVLRCCKPTQTGVTKVKMDEGHQRQCCQHPKTTREEGKKLCNEYGYVLCTHAEKNLAHFTLPECTDHSDPWFADEAAGSSGHTGPASASSAGSGSSGHTGPASASSAGSGSSGHTGPASASGSSGHTGPANANKLAPIEKKTVKKIGAGHRNWKVIHDLIQKEHPNMEWKEIRKMLRSSSKNKNQVHRFMSLTQQLNQMDEPGQDFQETAKGLPAEFHTHLLKPGQEATGEAILTAEKKATEWRDLLGTDIQETVIHSFEGRCGTESTKEIKQALAELKLEPELSGKNWPIGKIKCNADPTSEEDCECDGVIGDEGPFNPIKVDFDNKASEDTLNYIVVIQGTDAPEPDKPVHCVFILVAEAEDNTFKHKYRPITCPKSPEVEIGTLKKQVGALEKELKDTTTNGQRRRLLQGRNCGS